MSTSTDNGTKKVNGSSVEVIDFQEKLLTYSEKIQDILEKIQANVKESRFVFERTENGMKFDIALKASVNPNPFVKTIPKKETAE